LFQFEVDFLLKDIEYAPPFIKLELTQPFLAIGISKKKIQQAQIQIYRISE